MAGANSFEPEAGACVRTWAGLDHDVVAPFAGVGVHCFKLPVAAVECAISIASLRMYLCQLAVVPVEERIAVLGTKLRVCCWG